MLTASTDTDSTEEVMVALALLPYDIDIGTKLKWENFTYTISE